MPLFLTNDQIYRIIQRELPPLVYPDGPASGFYSTADSYATAQIVADSYANLSDIYDNYFPNYATDRQADWETLVLGYPLDASLSLQDRRDRVIAKIRSQRRTTAADMLATVYTVLDSSVLVEIGVPSTGNYGGWVLDVSQLDIGTFLNSYNYLELVGADLCTKDAADFGLTPEEFADYQDGAYTYYVLIYGYTLSTTQRAELDLALSAAEPARSTHIILDGLDPADTIGGDT